MQPEKSTPTPAEIKRDQFFRYVMIGLWTLIVGMVLTIMICAGFQTFDGVKIVSMLVYVILVAVLLAVLGTLATLRHRGQKKQILFTWLTLGGVLILTIWLASFRSGDWKNYLNPWITEYRALGWADAFQKITEVSDYTPLYNYWLIFIAHVFSAQGCLYAVKYLSFWFSVALAVVMELLICELRQTKFNYLHVACFLLFPPILLEFTTWAQCDAIYITFCLLGFYFALKHRSVPCFVSLGLAFALKLQVLFIAPMIFVMLIIRDADGQRYLHWRWVWLVPLLYAVNLIPVCFGASLGDLLLVYFNQTGVHQVLSANCLNLSFLFNWKEVIDNRLAVLIIAIILAVIGITVTIVLLVLVFRANRRQTLTHGEITRYAWCFALIMVYFMPLMHDRFFLVALMLSVVYALSQNGQWYRMLSTMLTFSVMISMTLFLIYDYVKLPADLSDYVNSAGLVVNTLLVYWLLSPIIRAEITAHRSKRNPTPPTEINESDNLTKSAKWVNLLYGKTDNEPHRGNWRSQWCG